MKSPPIRSLFADDPEMAELVQRFVAALPSRIAKLREAAADPVARGFFQRLAHQLAGAAGGYGFPQLSDAARRLELAISHGQDGATALEALAALCRQVGAEGCE
jgi:HPt (histidine-containing phosphotransfer) domain-containing protein